MRHPTHKNCPTCAARERARIRRLIGPALNKLHLLFVVHHRHGSGECEPCRLMDAIDAATKPESKRKVKK